MVCFHNFLRMPSNRGHLARSLKFSCFDHEWSLCLYPGGSKASKDGRVALYLRHCGQMNIEAKFMLTVRNDQGKIAIEKASSRLFTTGGPDKGHINGWPNFAKRDKLINPSYEILHNGSLIVEVRIKPHEDHYCLNFIPRNGFAPNMLKAFMDEDSADIMFEVPSQEKSSTVSAISVFPAHKLILQFCAAGSTLAALCEDYDDSTPVPLLDIRPNLFRQMLYYIYGGAISSAEWKQSAKDFIDAADRYGVRNLKIEAEAWYVKHLKLTAENAVEALLYGDQKNCFLLKEVAMDFILQNTRDVLNAASFEKVTESQSILRETISVAAKMGMHCSSEKESQGDVRDLSINILRAMNYIKGNDIDGPRNQLIAQLGL